MKPLMCAEARNGFALMLYGELSFDEEERIDTHLDGCPECRAAFEREKALHAAFDGAAAEPSPSLLRECRAELSLRLDREPAPVRESWWKQVLSIRPVTFTWSPVGAVALVALGFFAAKVTPLLNRNAIDATQAGMARVRGVETAPNGGIRIVVDETRQRTISGGLDDQQIRGLLMQAMQDPSDPGLRAETVDLLNTREQSSEVRDALIYALRNDRNDGVRFKALQGLRRFAGDEEVRDALSQTLLTDANSGVRSQAIDLLIQSSGGSNVDRELIGTLQQLMMQEDNAYVRQQSQRMLSAYRASPEIY